MGNWKAMIKKNYGGKNVRIAREVFGNAIEEADYYKAARVGVLMAIIKGGARRLIKILRRATLSYDRLKKGDE